jgi:hypothetical protein
VFGVFLKNTRITFIAKKYVIDVYLKDGARGRIVAPPTGAMFI